MFNGLGVKCIKSIMIFFSYMDTEGKRVSNAFVSKQKKIIFILINSNKLFHVNVFKKKVGSLILYVLSKQDSNFKSVLFFH